jgi:hypothetical protein
MAGQNTCQPGEKIKKIHRSDFSEASQDIIQYFF